MVSRPVLTLPLIPLLLALVLTLPPDVFDIVLAVVGVNVGLVRLLLFVGVPFLDKFKIV